MAGSSSTARMAVAWQGAKGTAATANFLSGLFTNSHMAPAFTYLRTLQEHGGAATQRPTAKRSSDYRESALMEWGGAGRLYPALLGTLLRGSGFGVASVNNTTHRTHTFTIADRSAAAWLSVMHRLNEGGDQFERKARDARVQKLTVRAGRDGIEQSFEGLALSEAQSSGSETVASETNIPFVPSEAGSISLTVGGTNLVAQTKNVEITIDNALGRDEYFLFGFGNADLPPTGLRVSGSIGDIDLSYDLYKRLHWGGAAGTGMVPASVEGALSLTYESAVNIAGAAVPYALTFAIPVVQVQPVAPVAQDDQLIRVGLNWEMVDAGAGAPITITLVNLQTAYA